MIHTVFVPKHHPLTFLCIWNWQAESLSSSYTLYNEVFEVPENSKQQKPQHYLKINTIYEEIQA